MQANKMLKTLLSGSGKTVSTAESCTGGAIASLITSIPGSSEYFKGSIISYSAEIKEKMLKVDSGIIRKYGIVSSEVAASMAEGIRNLLNTTYSISTTGLAGPGGDNINPVGTVWIGISGPNGTKTIKKVFSKDRITNIQLFADSALAILIEYINNKID